VESAVGEGTRFIFTIPKITYMKLNQLTCTYLLWRQRGEDANYFTLEALLKNVIRKQQSVSQKNGQKPLNFLLRTGGASQRQKT